MVCPPSRRKPCADQTRVAVQRDGINATSVKRKAVVVCQHIQPGKRSALIGDQDREDTAACQLLRSTTGNRK
jgi:hypothetical protein